MNHLSEDDLVLLHYGEPGAPEGAREHVRECAECRESADCLARSLEICDEWRAPEPDAQFERAVWAGLAPQLAKPHAVFRPRIWFAAAAMALLLVGAFFAGRGSRLAPRPVAVGLSSQARERILRIAAADQLDRTGMLLTELSNSDARDFVTLRDRAQDLVEESRLMRQMLALGGENSTAGVLDEVERVLVEVANAPERLGASDVLALRDRIEAGSLLFKVRIVESNLRTQGQRL